MLRLKSQKLQLRQQAQGMSTADMARVEQELMLETTRIASKLQQELQQLTKKQQEAAPSATSASPPSASAPSSASPGSGGLLKSLAPGAASSRNGNAHSNGVMNGRGGMMASRRAVNGAGVSRGVTGACWQRAAAQVVLAISADTRGGAFITRGGGGGRTRRPKGREQNKNAAGQGGGGEC